MNQAGSAQASRVVALGFLVVGAVFFASGLFRRELYALNAPLYWIFDFFKFIVLPAAVLLLLAKRYGVQPKHYGLRGLAERESWATLLGLAVFLALILDLAYYASWYIGWLIFGPGDGATFYQEINPAGPLRIPVTLYMALTAGIVEEIFFRGLPLFLLERWFPNEVPRHVYVLGTAVVFGLIHWPNGPHEVLATFAFGLLAAGIYLRLRDLWPLIVAHALVDIYGFA